VLEELIRSMILAKRSQEFDQEEGLHEDQLMGCYVERYKTIATPMNS